MANCLYDLFPFDTFSKKLVPNDTLVVKIELKIIKPYIYLTSLEIFETMYTAGISKFSIFTSTFANMKKIINDNMITNVVVIIEIIVFSFSLSIKFLKAISIGINKIVL